MTKLEEANEIIEHIRADADTCILFCSLGKDSLVTLDLIYPKFKKVICVFMYFVKGLEHIECWVSWVKTHYPNVEFVQVPHWNLSYLLRGGMYCTPQPKIKLIKLADVIANIRLKYNAYYCFLGMKKADGMNRRLMLNTYESNRFENNGLVYPLANWTQKEIMSYMKHHRMPTPVRYGLTASSGAGFNIDFFLWTYKNFPQDLERVYEVFPLSKRILFEYNERHKEELEYGEKEING